jgi:hypothetical protein
LSSEHGSATYTKGAVNIRKLNILLKTEERIMYGPEFRGIDVLRLKRTQYIPIQHGGGGIGNIQHTTFYLLPYCVLRVPDQNEAKQKVHCKKERAYQDQRSCGWTQSLHKQFPPLSEQLKHFHLFSKEPAFLSGQSSGSNFVIFPTK